MLVSRKLMFLFCLAMMINGAAFAQGKTDGPDQMQVFWEKNIDESTEWGKWLTSSYKPYMQELQSALQKFLKQADFDMSDMSENESKDKITEVESDYYKAIRDITPPPEFKGYHTKIMEIFAEKFNKRSPNEDLINKLVGESSQELEQVFQEHGVPQKIIDKLK